jgi:hypothetical protein
MKKINSGPETLRTPEATPEAQLPSGICAEELGKTIDRLPIDAARRLLVSFGLQDMADSLAGFTDVFTDCQVPECPSFLKVSNQAGTIEILDSGSREHGCIRADS